MIDTQRPTVSVERLTGADVTRFRELLALFAAAFEEPETYLDRQPDDAYLRDLLAGEHFLAIVAISEGRVVGGLAGYFLHKFERVRKEIYVYDLAVAESHRRQGIGRAMLRHLKELAKDLDAYVIFIQADGDNPPAIALYDSLGKRDEVLHFDIEPSD